MFVPKSRVLFWIAALALHLTTPITFAAEPPANAVDLDTRYGGTLTIDPEGFYLYDVPQQRMSELAGFEPKWMAPEPSPRLHDTKSRMAVGRVLTVLVQWLDHSGATLWHPPAAYDSLLYSDGIYPTGSVNDYYQEVSYNQFSIAGNAVGWITLASTYDGSYSINEIVAAIDPIVNFDDYDGDGDGYVDALWLVHAGPGQEETHNPLDIWSHAYRGVHVETADATDINGWSMQPEMHANFDIISIRVFCHEYGHILGMPDLYDYDAKLDTNTYKTPNDANDHPLVDWDVMGYAGYSIMSYGNTTCPSHYSAWSRIRLGWAAAEIPLCLDGTYDLYNIETYSTQNIYKVPITDDGTEYFLLEYRNPRSSAQFDHLNSDFSAYCPWFTPGRDTLDQGLLVTHIDTKVYPNNGPPGRPNYGVRVIDAGYDPAHPWDGSEFTEWWYPYEFRIGALYSPDDPGQTELSPTTTPSSDGYTGPSGVTITVLSQNSEYITISVDKPARPVFDAVAPIALDAGQIRNQVLVANDLNCTAPALTPLSIPTFATFADSGNGHGLLFLAPLIGDEGNHTATFRCDDSQLADTLVIAISVAVPPCLCPCPGDPGCDGVVNVLDVVTAVGEAFRSGTPISDPVCPNVRTDVDCSGFVNVLDVVKFVNVAFRSGTPAAEFCDPCGP